ncbi:MULTISPECIES: AMP-binding protein [Bacillus]|uniref:3-[(3aS,4S,7aS)-7a-methyl-1, 5-dioxo-octahydro-1H-inden-4-yl]propanoyl:CoA ligase n=1 Tax=Bacillus velezensis TaxID=492670 RepID=A0A411A6Q7_BACVE|nr:MULTISPECIES: AMP-binding protein [Bacillus]APA02927.1 AMP-binding protein [Bacillus velezensis]ASB53337.1 Putative acyl-CoA synthetase YngI [Bacillus velezensis]ASB65611.1 Putative acyl-CoA synthetase YngI [Bacillus velezensis]AVB11718.1 AMP-binding protein [Bacillus velezensis]AXS60950.1 AMP-binding protein [Bacillus velezensis]
MAELIHLTAGKLLERTAKLFPDHEAVVYPERSLRYTYAEFDRLCRQTAKGLMKLGVEKGDHVAIWASNIPEWLAAQFATAKIGAVLVTINTNFQIAELDYLLAHSDVSSLIIMDSYRQTSYVEMVNKLIPELKTCERGRLRSKRYPFLRTVLYIGDKSPTGMHRWDSLLKDAESVTDAELDGRMDSLEKGDCIHMQYTSGTTGFPKGVMLSHFNIVNNAANIAECMKLTSCDRLCIPVPFFHCFGCVLGVLACVSAGAAMIPIEQFSPPAVLKTVEKEACTALHGVPTMFIALLNDSHFSEYDLSHVRTGIMAGSPCPAEGMREVIGKMGMTDITIAYGQTEASPVITQTRTDDSFERRVETAGRALPHIEVRIVRPGTSQEAARGEQGELCTRGYHVMKGYYKNQEATEEAIDKDGWLHTGDLAVMDEDGYCKITGRLKDMLIRGGENIYPREIEEMLYRHPAVADVQVVGVPDPKYGEEAAAWIRLKDGQTASAEDIRAFCKEHIARYKVPRYVLFTDEYPMTASGKIQKFKLREKTIEELKLT